MDNAQALEIARKYVSVLKTKFDCREVYLFGSYAKGTQHDESDIDIAVVLGEFDSSYDMRLELMRLRRPIDSRIEPHPFRVKEFNENNPLAFEISKYGLKIS